MDKKSVETFVKEIMKEEFEKSLSDFQPIGFFKKGDDTSFGVSFSVNETNKIAEGNYLLFIMKEAVEL